MSMDLTTAAEAAHKAMRDAETALMAASNAAVVARAAADRASLGDSTAARIWNDRMVMFMNMSSAVRAEMRKYS